MARKTKQAAPGASLREAAAVLEVSRKKLLRYVRQGLPVIRQSERVYVDLAEARAWLALNADAAEPTVLAYAPDDPRNLERRESARLAWLKMAVKAGVMLDLEDVVYRYSVELLNCRNILLSVSKYFIAGDDPAGIPAAIEEALASLRMDDPSAWPVQAIPAAPELADEESEADPDAVYAPRYSTADPRFAIHQQKAEKARLAYEALAATLVSRDAVLEEAEIHFEAIRRRVRRIPAKIETLESEIRLALVQLSETQTERVRREVTAVFNRALAPNQNEAA